jgi:hypothetical protein
MPQDETVQCWSYGLLGRMTRRSPDNLVSYLDKFLFCITAPLSVYARHSDAPIESLDNGKTKRLKDSPSWRLSVYSFGVVTNGVSF